MNYFDFIKLEKSSILFYINGIVFYIHGIITGKGTTIEKENEVVTKWCSPDLELYNLKN